MTRRAIGVSERPPLLQTIPLSFQHLFAMFGATVLVPILFKINPATVLLFNGIGTLLYLFICKGKIPAYLGSSFAFISPVLLLLPLGYEVALGGFIMCGVLFCLVALIVKKAGTGWLDVMLPPAAMGAIVAVIGLELAGVAANMAGLLPAEGASADSTTITISLVTLAVTVLGSVLFRGFLAIIPILIGVLVGYALSFFMGVVDLTPIREAHWFALPMHSPGVRIWHWWASRRITAARLRKYSLPSVARRVLPFHPEAIGAGLHPEAGGPRRLSGSWWLVLACAGGGLHRFPAGHGCARLGAGAGVDVLEAGPLLDVAGGTPGLGGVDCGGDGVGDGETALVDQVHGDAFDVAREPTLVLHPVAAGAAVELAHCAPPKPYRPRVGGRTLIA